MGNPDPQTTLGKAQAWAWGLLALALVVSATASLLLAPFALIKYLF